MIFAVQFIAFKHEPRLVALISPNATIPHPHGLFLSSLWRSRRLPRASQIRWLRVRLPLGRPPAHGLSSDAKGSAKNITGADLLGLSREKVNAIGARWPIRGSDC